MKSVRSILCFGLVTLVCLSGCGGGKLKTYKVRGKITFNDQPVGNAVVNFVPKDPSKAAYKAAQGITREDGTYDLGTNASGDGAMEGDYVVTVVKRPSTEQRSSAKIMTPSGPGGAGATQGGTGGDDYQKMMIGKGADDAGKKVSTELPVRYAKAETTDLFASVGPSSPSEFNFDLKP